MKGDWYVCSWDDFGQFWKRHIRFTGHYAKQDAEDLARFWGDKYRAKPAKLSISIL